MFGDLDTLTITDFRSIQGTISVPLNAPIVLLHGPNGAGKTSVLAALELALTGNIAVMRNDDTNFLQHLVHLGSSAATIRLTGPQFRATSARTPGQTTIRDGKLTHGALLNASEILFFTERCYLAQSVLSRLLEIYQHADAQKTSPLTRFVKDLLRLDELDALVDGLSSANDLRLMKNLAPLLRTADERRATYRQRRDAAANSCRDRWKLLIPMREAFQKMLAALPSAVRGQDGLSLAAQKAQLSIPFEESRLTSLIQWKRELASLQSAWSSLPRDASAENRSALELEEHTASIAAEGWRTESGAELDRAIDTLRSLFPDLPSWESTSPAVAHSTALGRAQAEMERVKAAIAADSADATHEIDLDQQIGRSVARLNIIEDQLKTVTESASGLSGALAGIIPHIHGDDCPVCGRDFAELGEGSLLEHVQLRIAALTEEAGRLSGLAIERSQAQRASAQLRREKQTVSSRRIAGPALLVLQTRFATLQDAVDTLARLEPATILAAQALMRQQQAQKRLAELRDRDRRATDLRFDLEQFCERAGQSLAENSESTEAALHRLEAAFIADETTWLSLSTSRIAAATACDALIRAESALISDETQLKQAGALYDAVDALFLSAERQRQQARTVASAARGVRTSIVRRVFNEGLNDLWRDLFVRLSPTEPYIPAFRLSETAQGVLAQLETRHRSGATGGTPGSMLSAGNLNTAALTLFLALHLSVEAKLPWLVLDDPVQSMDEVHIAQFAALLRTLSKDNGRKIVIAVHERSLFDYLALELSPAFPEDRLIMVELTRSAESNTIATSKILTYHRDVVLAA
jgi:exonuclease SbcC